ncbi:hypothetical protein MKK84_27875 [Methylobacterium sp. E-065]|uniref:hypothetical protein n=1 Tax=Methylobacterium sp. E-065 TaxID=2836583 RepID=UPI001FBB8FD2|nr:hypothetical protein [Methylobacterium sp. E-065]MCJ2021190.1 hypothetical protein [Methylobacterium sp. E-065]
MPTPNKTVAAVVNNGFSASRADQLIDDKDCILKYGSLHVTREMLFGLEKLYPLPNLIGIIRASAHWIVTRPDDPLVVLRNYLDMLCKKAVKEDLDRKANAEAQAHAELAPSGRPKVGYLGP